MTYLSYTMLNSSLASFFLLNFERIFRDVFHNRRARAKPICFDIGIDVHGRRTLGTHTDDVQPLTDDVQRRNVTETDEGRRPWTSSLDVVSFRVRRP